MEGNFFKDRNMMCRIGISSGFLIAGGSAAYGVHQTVKFVKKKFAGTNLTVQAIEGSSTSGERFPSKLNDKLESSEVYMGDYKQISIEGASTSGERFPSKLNDKLESSEVYMMGDFKQISEKLVDKYIELATIRSECEVCKTLMDDMPSFKRETKKIALGFLTLLAIFALNKTIKTYKYIRGAPPTSGSSKTA